MCGDWGQQTGLWERMRHPFGDTQKKWRDTYREGTIKLRESWVTKKLLLRVVERIKQEKSREVWRTHTKYFISYISFLKVIKNSSNVLKLTQKNVCLWVWCFLKKTELSHGTWRQEFTGPQEELQPRTEKPFWKQRQQVNFFLYKPLASQATQWAKTTHHTPEFISSVHRESFLMQIPKKSTWWP